MLRINFMAIHILILVENIVKQEQINFSLVLE